MPEAKRHAKDIIAQDDVGRSGHQARFTVRSCFYTSSARELQRFVGFAQYLFVLQKIGQKGRPGGRESLPPSHEFWRNESNKVALRSETKFSFL